MNLEQYYQMVENCISKLGVDPATCRGEKPGQWDLKRGSASVWADVFVLDNGYGYFQCMAPVAKIPANNTLAFYEEIMEKNHDLFGTGMTKYKDWVYMKTVRELEGLDENEIIATFNRVSGYADDLDDYYKEKYPA